MRYWRLQKNIAKIVHGYRRSFKIACSGVVNLENAEFFRQVLRDFGGLVVLADPKKPFMQPKVGERILKVFSQFGYTPEMFRNDISSSKDVAFQRSRAFLHLVDEDTNHDRATEEKIYLVIEVGDKYAVVPLFYDSVWR